MSETTIAPQLDPEKFHVPTTKTKILAVLVSLLVLFVVIPACGFFYYRFAINRPSQSGKETQFAIDKGSGLPTIGDMLYEKGVINSKFLFFVYTRMTGLDKSIQAGSYTAPAGITLVQLANLIQHGTNDTKVTFLEGWRVEEFAREAATILKNIDYMTFTELARKYEGRLFPDTYYINAEMREQDLVNLLVNTFETKTAGLFVNPNLTKDQVIILASIVEREIHTETERPIVAGILVKRFKNGELVGADATTQYAVARLKMGCLSETDYACPSKENFQNVEWWPENLTFDDLASTSLYNTRKVVGLPPAPISNPGVSAIKAVVSYQETPYNFYLTDSNGNVHYAKTLEEHNINVSKYIR